MLGTILQVVNGGSVWLLVVSTEGRIVEQPVEARYWGDIVQAEGLTSPYDLEGRDIELSDDGLSIGLP
jgi:hypothetical protein